MTAKRRLIYEQVTLSNLGVWKTCMKTDGKCHTYSTDYYTENGEDKNETIMGCYLPSTRRYSTSISGTMNLPLIRQESNRRFFLANWWRPNLQYVRNESGWTVMLMIFPGRRRVRGIVQDGFAATTSKYVEPNDKFSVPMDVGKNNLFTFAVIDTCSDGRVCVPVSEEPFKTNRTHIIVPHQLSG